MKKFLLFLLFPFSALTFAQNFSGSIELVQLSPKDTLKKMYRVKGQKVKLDEFTKKGNSVSGSFIFNLDSGNVKFVITKRRIWIAQKKQVAHTGKGKYTVTKGTATKNIAGYDCVDYTVSNAEENTSITYWMAEGGFSFYAPLVAIWNRKDRQSIYFRQIKNLGAGQMPLMSEESHIYDKKIVSRIEVKSISKNEVADSEFEIPEGFQKFNH